MRVLDAGSGTQPYRHLFAHAHYESADLMQVEKAFAAPDYVCDLASIPVQDGRFDRVIFNQVLEHVAEPKEVLAELGRVLKPGGKIICTCPFFFEEHEVPFDYFRYTQFAHRHLFEAAGFRVLSVAWLEGWLGTVGYMLRAMARFLPFRPVGAGFFIWLCWPLVILAKLTAFFLAGVFYRLDRHCKLTGPGFPKNYMVIAEKP